LSTRSGHGWACWRRFPGFWVAGDLCRHVCPLNADFRNAKWTHIPYGKPQCFSRDMDALCEVIFRPRGPRVTPLLRCILSSSPLGAWWSCVIGGCNGSLQWPGAPEKYLTIELSSTRNSVQNTCAFVSDFQSAKIGESLSASVRPTRTCHPPGSVYASKRTFWGWGDNGVWAMPGSPSGDRVGVGLARLSATAGASRVSCPVPCRGAGRVRSWAVRQDSAMDEA
jgi:hypothetical protein